MTLFLVHLELAREKGHPDGSALHGYDIVAPLGPDGHLDAAAWKQNRSRCTVRRFWYGEDDQKGELIHTRGGRWALSYDPTTDEDDEAMFRMDSHIIRKGEYISITEPGNQRHTFRIVSITAV
ncbi:MAG: hypothetical protein OJJ21_05410 [Ferrovibrio sp.]|uniref:hypothetical protein n=1 Tax=Ferrovibrio sp. TaxID=1917215 RepID=UPI002601FFEC|nr:hypothetical protein [Ferrovibrio sp.]MCW0233019.1 hypothetical protein [Ferrovibrio sp.]